MRPGRRRFLSLSVVAAGMAVLHGVAPDTVGRERALSLLALPLGYGHLLGAWWAARPRRRRGGVERAFAAASVLTALCAYTWALQQEALQQAVLLPMLLASGWHIAENDLALARNRRDRTRLPPLPRRGTPHALALGATLLVGLTALATPEGAAYLATCGATPLPFETTTLPDLLTAVLMYHALCFVLLGLEHARHLPPAAGRQLRGRLVAAHTLPLAINAALFRAFPELHLVLATPALYLFFSVLHAFHTAAQRGVEPGPGRSRTSP